MIGFIIMQIGDASLDAVCEEAIVPAIESNGLAARRVDKHNSGGLLKSEIVEFINEAQILVADLTNERPNVYLEIGYAMGIEKFKNLILTVRKDHFLDSPDREPHDPKVHFDLAGYDILPWNPDDVPAFREELTKRIARRLALVDRPAGAGPQLVDDTWLDEQRVLAVPGLNSIEGGGRMELCFALQHPKPQFTLGELREAARSAPIHTFGWPIGVFAENREDIRPKPRPDGIAASVMARVTGPSYDYWALRRNGDYYLAKSLWEDKRNASFIYFNTRIVRVAESLMYCYRLYSALGVDRASVVSITVRHSGFKGRALGSSNSNRDNFLSPHTEENESETTLVLSLDDLEANLVSHVRSVLDPMFELFEFFQLSGPVYEDIVSKFVAGNVT